MVVATTSVFLTTLLLCIMLSTDYAYNWIEILNRAGSTISRIEKSRLLRSIASADFTAGAVSISTPPISSESMLQMENTELEDDENMASMYRSTLGKSITVNGTRPGLARMHRLSRTIIRKVPDGALIGIVALITTELIQREVIRQSTSFPPIMQALANRTLSELDGKLQLLSFLQWNFEPFLRVEVENLQTQPVELLDKYIVTEILQRVDKELSPFLTKLLADPGKVKDITAKIKDIIKLLALLVIKPSNRVSNSPLGKTTNSIIENVEVVGMSVESALLEWNRIIEDLGKLIKAENLTDLLLKIDPSGSSIRRMSLFQNSISTTAVEDEALLSKERITRSIDEGTDDMSTSMIQKLGFMQDHLNAAPQSTSNSFDVAPALPPQHADSSTAPNTMDKDNNKGKKQVKKKESFEFFRFSPFREQDLKP